LARLAEVWSAATESGFSGVALVRQEGRELGRFAAGWRDRDQGLPNTLDTAFDIGSITKQFTGAAIMRLHEQGLLGLQTPLGELFDGVPADKASITIHQLLTHTAGFASALGSDDEPIERAAYLERAWGKRLSAEPGTLHWYSNTGYSILGAVIERLTGLSYDEYLRAELLQPLGIERTGYLEPVWAPSQVALGYAEGAIDDPLQRPHAADGYYWNLRANGGLLSTVADLTRWSDALLGGEVLGPDALTQYLTPHVPEGLGSDAHYAYGWAIEDTSAGRLVSHTGGNGFFFAEVRQYIDADVLLVLLSNESEPASGSDVVETLASELAAAVLPVLPSPDEPPEPEPLAIDREESLEDTTHTFTEAVEFPAERDSAVAGFFFELESGSASYRLIAPGGDVFDSGVAVAGDPTERIIVVPPRLGAWQLEVDVRDATGTAYFAWLWE
jgi:CubicO group peptidase (beta-lactamase class C family)